MQKAKKWQYSYNCKYDSMLVECYDNSITYFNIVESQSTLYMIILLDNDKNSLGPHMIVLITIWDWFSLLQ